VLIGAFPPPILAQTWTHAPGTTVARTTRAHPINGSMRSGSRPAMSEIPGTAAVPGVLTSPHRSCTTETVSPPVSGSRRATIDVPEGGVMPRYPRPWYVTVTKAPGSSPPTSTSTPPAQGTWTDGAPGVAAGPTSTRSGSDARRSRHSGIACVISSRSPAVSSGLASTKLRRW